MPESRPRPLSFEQLDPDAQLEHLRWVARRALTFWNWPDDASLELISLSENATYKLSHPQRSSPVVLRVHRTGYHTLDAIRSELSWTRALQRDIGLITPQPIANPHGETIACVHHPRFNERRYAVLFDWIDGAAPEEQHLLAPFRRLGAITARLHRHAIQWPRPAFFTRLTWDFDGCLGRVQHWGDWRCAPGLNTADTQVLELAEALLCQRLAAFGKSQQRFGLIHADMRLANLLEYAGDTRVIDFDDAGFGWFLYDLAAALSFIETRPDLQELIQAWVEGYRSCAALSEQEVAEIPTFVLLRRMTLLAWVGSHSETELAQSQGEAFALGTVQLANAYLTTMAKVPQAEPQP